MKKMKSKILTIFLITILLLAWAGCSSRIEMPVTGADLTIVYPAKKADGISAKITFYRKISKKTGKRIDEGTVFTIKEKRNTRALVDIENRFAYGDRELMFHIDWIGENGKSFYRKRIDISPGDSTFSIMSSISISPDKRAPGICTLRIYFFRELIAEKKFELRPEPRFTHLEKGEEITARISLYRKISKKTGKRIDEGTVFTIKKKAKVRAIIDLENRFAYGDQELTFYINWIGEDGKSFYRKRIELSPNDSTLTLVSSISIIPDKRPPGKYALQIHLFSQLIGEEVFELRAKTKK